MAGPQVGRGGDYSPGHVYRGLCCLLQVVEEEEEKGEGCICKAGD